MMMMCRFFGALEKEKFSAVGAVWAKKDFISEHRKGK